MDVSTQIDATNLSSQPTAPALGQAIPQDSSVLWLAIESPQFPPRLPAPLHPHSDSPLYLTHSTTNQSGGGAQGDSVQGLHIAGGLDLTTWF